MYLLVIDMAKDIQSEVGSNERHNVKDSLFEYWTFYGTILIISPLIRVCVALCASRCTNKSIESHSD